MFSIGCYPNRLIFRAKQNTAVRVIAHTTGGDGALGGCITRVSAATRSVGEGCKPPRDGLERQSPVSDAFLHAGEHASIPPPNPLAFPDFPAPAAEAP